MEESMEEMEARLYAQVYHDTSVEEVPETSDYLPLNLNKQSNKRYWQQSKNLSTQKDFNQQPSFNYAKNKLPAQEKFIAPAKPEIRVPENKELAAPALTKAFVPYSSVLSFMASPLPLPEVSTNNYEKKKNKAAKFPKAGKVLNPLNKQGVTKGKSAMKMEIQIKKQKATIARKKAQNQNNKVLTTIELHSEESDSDCIPIELPPPPLITLDSSDEETIRKKRAMSPSTASIISDDFIVAGDKRRLANPFKSEEGGSKILRKIAEQKATLEKVKALTKVPSSTSSSDSARSSAERTIAEEPKPTQEEKSSVRNKRIRNKDRSLSDNSKEDSIYSAKTAKITKPSVKDPAVSSSEEETLYVNAKNVRRRKSTGSRKKSTDCDLPEIDEDPMIKLISSTPIVQVTKRRSRFITPSYNEDEFASMISTIVNPGEEMEDEESVDESEAVKENSKNVTTITVPDSTLSETIEQPVNSSEIDCEIIEQPLVVFEVPDENSDSDDSMRGFNKPIECDLSLNVTSVPYDPHEYIRDHGNSSKEIQPPDNITVNPEIGWNDEMKFFYDGSWSDESFCISSILQAMPRDQKLWKIIGSDRNRTFDSGCRVRCKKCNEIGHYAAKCSKPKKRVVCFMCGAEGHRETRCPNSICLRCGNPNRMFTEACSGCIKKTRKRCPLCRYQGHDIEQCPDKWRRYHSTTTETTELVSDFQVNKRMYCSICARSGHFAENCSQFFKTISGLITSSSFNITSHKPSYPHFYLNSFTQNKTENRGGQQLLNLFTYFPYFRFNFQFNRNVRSYPKFLEHFKAHMKRKEQASLQAIEAPVKEKSTKKKNRKVEVDQKKGNELKITINGEESPAITTHATLVEPVSATEHHDDSNSNYSFTEYYKPSQSQSSNDETFKAPGDVNEWSFEKAMKSVHEPSIHVEKSQEVFPKLLKNPFATDVSKLADFIPLSNENSPRETPIIREELRTDVRMLLTKDHFKILSSQKGQNFLYDLQNRLNLVSQFQWDSKITGNSLLISGLPNDQSIFNVEVREFLYKLEVDRYEKQLATSSMLPKTKIRIVSMLKVNLQSLSKVSTYTIKKTLDAMIEAERNFDHKKALKCRKTLNIAFIGDAELADGGQHIGALRRITHALEKDLVQGNHEMSLSLRDEIVDHMKPIFSTMNHGDYRKLYSDYTKVMRQRHKRGLLLNPVIY